jgi:hypothetical protein
MSRIALAVGDCCVLKTFLNLCCIKNYYLALLDKNNSHTQPSLLQRGAYIYICATSHKAAGSIPDGATGIFY